MPEISISTILAGREAIDAYREAHSQLHHRVQGDRVLPIDHSELSDQMLSALKMQGFESIDEFYKANEQAVLEDIARCVRYEGECDFCVGREAGCVKSCYESTTQPDISTPTGRTKLIPGFEGRQNVAATLSYYKDYYKSLPPRQKGQTYPQIPRCSIMTRIIDDPALDWYWE